MRVEWGLAKAVLLFCGLLAKGLALGPALPFVWGETAKTVSKIVWPAFDGAFMWLLQPPTKRKGDRDSS